MKNCDQDIWFYLQAMSYFTLFWW